MEKVAEATEPRRLLMLVQENDKCTVREWLRKMRDRKARAIILRHIDKLARGLGDHKGLQGVIKLKIDFSTGYRVYYAFLDGQTVVVLICGGDKKTQRDDIKNAQDLWNDFNKNGQPQAALRDWDAVQDAVQAPAEPEPDVNRNLM